MILCKLTPLDSQDLCRDALSHERSAKSQAQSRDSAEITKLQMELQKVSKDLVHYYSLKAAVSLPLHILWRYKATIALASYATLACINKHIVIDDC